MRTTDDVPGIGPIISSATVAAIGNGAAFSKGRDFGAWLGLVPRQISTGDRTILGKSLATHGRTIHWVIERTRSRGTRCARVGASSGGHALTHWPRTAHSVPRRRRSVWAPKLWLVTTSQRRPRAPTIVPGSKLGVAVRRSDIVACCSMRLLRCEATHPPSRRMPP